jgi:hypothetical protein
MPPALSAEDTGYAGAGVSPGELDALSVEAERALVRSLPGGHFLASMTEAAMPGGLGRIERDEPETAGEKVQAAAGAVGGTVLSFIGPAAAARVLTAPFRAASGLAKLAERSPRLARLAEAGIRNVVAFNIHGQMQAPPG